MGRRFVPQDLMELVARYRELVTERNESREDDRALFQSEIDLIDAEMNRILEDPPYPMGK